MKKIFENKRIITALIVIIAIILLYTLSIFLTFKSAIDDATRNEYYKEARAYMAAAEQMNESFIFPLSHMTHWEHPITKPFYAIRDKLYNIGMSKFPKDEGEREIWWYKIKYVEYRDLVEDNLIAYEQKKDYAIPKFVYSKVGKFHEWNNELYSHIQPIAKAKITDPDLAKFKLDMYVQAARLYVSMNSLLVLQPGYQHPWQGPPLIHWVSNKEVVKYDKIYQTYLNLLEYSKKYDKPSYDYFYNNIDRRMWGWVLTHEVSENIMMSKFYNDKLTCNDFYLKLFSDNQKIMRDYYKENEKNLSYGIKAGLSMDSSLVIPIVAYAFKNCNNFKDYSRYAFLKEKEYNHFSTWEQVKDNELSGLIQEKRYDELNRVKKALEKVK